MASGSLATHSRGLFSDSLVSENRPCPCVATCQLDTSQPLRRCKSSRVESTVRFHQVPLIFFTGDHHYSVRTLILVVCLVIAESYILSCGHCELKVANCIACWLLHNQTVTR
jgi:hypothetical protein